MIRIMFVCHGRTPGHSDCCGITLHSAANRRIFDIRLYCFSTFEQMKKNEAHCYTFISQSLSALSFEYSPFSALVSVILRLISFIASNYASILFYYF